MGEYNPSAPHIIGQEWVPIRNENFALSPQVNSFERGHSFRLAAARQVRDARFYTNTLPSQASIDAFLAAVYAKGTEEDSGPIRQVIIPVANVGTTAGSSTLLIINGDQIGGSATDALTFPGDLHYIQILPNATITLATTVSMAFNMNPYMQLLTNKRILDVQLLYSGNAYLGNNQDPVSEWADGTILAGLRMRSFSPAATVDFGSLLPGLPVPNTTAQIASISLGEVLDPFVNTNGLTPWRFIDLQRFVPFAANALTLEFFHNFGDASGTVLNNLRLFYDYAALKIVFCEEQRLMTGGLISNRYVPSQNNESMNLGTNVLTMRAIQTQTTDPVLNPGEYTVTLAAPNLGQRALNNNNANAGYPLLNEIRELYSIAPHPGWDIKIPFPVDQHIDDQFDKEQTHLIPQVTLHASGGPLTEPHVYGRQAVAQVYGTLSATQEVQDGLANGAASWPWVRFYARRWGDTTKSLLLDSPSIGGSSVTISPAEFDALDEIIDGWKEITLRFATPPSMGTGTQPQWRWTSSGELAGNRWEILGATAPAISGLPGSYLTLTPSPNQLSISTYGQPVSGSSINLGWIPQYAPFVTATVDDQTSDATLIFAQDLPAMSGFTVAGANQSLVGIGLDCGLNPCCIPTAIRYNQLTWTPFQTNTVRDTFTRSVASGWGSPDIGSAWVTSGGAASDYSVNGTVGKQTQSTLNVARTSEITNAGVNPDLYVSFQLAVLTGVATNSVIDILARETDGNNNYLVRISIGNGTLQPQIARRVGGVLTGISTGTSITHTGADTYTLRFQITGNRLRCKLWDATATTEPALWDISVVDNNITTGTLAQIRSILGAGVTNVLPFDINFDNFIVNNQVVDPDSFGYFELQRMDTIDTDWATIMKATNPSVSGFKDYEARVGIQASYRLRAVDLYDFPGPWSSTVSLTMASPGASGGCISNGHILIFTTNEVQNGSSNLAYSSVWEGMVEENFSFPEVQFVQLQAMYNRDFFTAFRPTERGGEQFQRTVLVQAAAISPPTLADFTSLRDMAWDNVSYICVRDEDGNRWFATVLVPSGKVRRDRRLYTAEVQIIEVTDTPSEVNP